MISTTQKKGVLNKNYADNRTKKKELAFRFRVRGEAVCWALNNFLDVKRQNEIDLLDMGSADGKTLIYLNQNHLLKSGLGIEYNSELIEKAGPLPKNISLIQGDITDLSAIPDESFDVVSALAVLEHLPNPIKAIQEASRLLRKGGLFIATSPVPFWDHISTHLGLLAEDHHECDMSPSFFRKLIIEDSALSLSLYKKF